jgi:hypothetical protein
VKCLNAGQICTSVDHAWLPQGKVDEFVRLAQAIVPARYPALASPDYTAILLGVLLESYTGLAVAAIGLLLLPVLKPHGRNLATAYLVLRAVECIVIVAIGIFFISSTSGFSNYDLLVYTFTGVGGIVLATLLLRSDLAPRWLSLLGGIGYAVLLMGVASDLLGWVDFDSPFGAAFYVPGALFELAFPLVLIFRGFGRALPAMHQSNQRRSAPCKTSRS